jgi:endonuclease-8
LIEAEHSGCNDGAGGSVTSSRCSNEVGRGRRFDPLVLRHGHPPTIPVTMLRPSAGSGYHAVVPDGEAIHRTAAALRTALVGRPLVSFEAPLLEGPTPATGRVIELVESHGRQLDVIWDDGLILHTSMRLSGTWHLYRTGERWRKPSSQLRASITVDGFSAVCFSARTVETYREFNSHRHPGFGPPGPDLSTDHPDLHAAVEALCAYPDLDASVAEALLDQHVASGVGNVFRSEILWASRQHPFAPVSMLGREDMERIVAAAAKVLQVHLHQPPSPVDGHRRGLAVYGRNGQRCPRCGDTVEVRRFGDHARLLYWCPGCQVHCGPRVVANDEAERAMDPHPAAAKFLADLPWRRRDLAG